VKKRRILVAEDEPVINDILCQVIREKGCSVLSAKDGKEALELVKKRAFDLILLDLMMPHVSGLEVLKESKRKNPETLVIVATAHRSVQAAVEVVKQGAYDFVTKPFGGEEISVIIDRALNELKLREDARRLSMALKAERKKVAEGERVRERELSSLLDISRTICSTFKLKEVLNLIVSKASEIMNSTACSIRLLDKSEKSLIMQASCGLSPNYLKKGPIKVGESVAGWVAQKKEIKYIRDIRRVKRLVKGLVLAKVEGLVSLMCAPIVVRGKVLGVLTVYSRSPSAFTGEENFFKILASQAGVAIDNARLYHSLYEVYMQTINTFVVSIASKDQYTYGHSNRVAIYAVETAEELGLPKEKIEILRQACHLHDLGKIGVYDYLLTKTGRLSLSEWEDLKRHTLAGAEILEPLTIPTEVVAIVRDHHERYDGKGYPFGKKGREIPIGARIVAVCDAFDAMLSRRPYREKPLTKEEAINELKKCSGSQFDPKVVSAFIQVLLRKKEIACRC
jgi:putative nucleotidyltransferase with HDIG domain